MPRRYCLRFECFDSIHYLYNEIIRFLLIQLKNAINRMFVLISIKSFDHPNRKDTTNQRLKRTLELPPRTRIAEHGSRGEVPALATRDR